MTTFLADEFGPLYERIDGLPLAHLALTFSTDQPQFWTKVDLDRLERNLVESLISRSLLRCRSEELRLLSDFLRVQEGTNVWEQLCRENWFQSVNQPMRRNRERLLEQKRLNGNFTNQELSFIVSDMIASDVYMIASDVYIIASVYVRLCICVALLQLFQWTCLRRSMGEKLQAMVGRMTPLGWKGR